MAYSLKLSSGEKKFKYKSAGKNQYVTVLKIKFKLGEVQQKSFKINVVVPSIIQSKKEQKTGTTWKFLTVFKIQSQIFGMRKETLLLQISWSFKQISKDS